MHKRLVIMPLARSVNRILFGALAVALSAFFLCAVPASAQIAPQSAGNDTPRSLLYITNSAAGMASLEQHVDSMDIVAPQTYAAKPNGTLLGVPDTQILKLASDAGASVMPLVVNQNFDQAGMHQLLIDPVAQAKLIASLVAESKKQGYIGFQFDFEHMQASDRDLYSAFVEKSAAAFHAAGLQLSVAVAPQQSSNPLDYGVGSWQNWTGAFDYTAIGAAADFVSVMAYDDSESVGPVASLPWVEQVLTYTLARIPASKVSLGIPFYTWVWNDKTGQRVEIRGYPAVAQLLDSGKYINKGFSNDLGVAYVTYKKGGQTLTAWYEDQQSFEQKLALVSDNHLAGFSAWTLGLEDPSDWSTMLAMRAPRDGLALR